MQPIADVIKRMRSNVESDSCANDEYKPVHIVVDTKSMGWDGKLSARSSFRTRYFQMDESDQEVSQMCIETEKWVRRYLTGSPESRLLVIYGRTGTGKSMVARKALAAIGAIGISSWAECHRTSCPGPRGALEWSQLASMGPADRNEGTIWIDAIEADVLILQDIGAEVDKFKSGAGIENLRILLEERRNKWTIITTNIPQENWEEAWDGRVDRRLNTNSVIVSVRNAPTFKKSGT